MKKIKIKYLMAVLILCGCNLFQTDYDNTIYPENIVGDWELNVNINEYYSNKNIVYREIRYDTGINSVHSLPRLKQLESDSGKYYSKYRDCYEMVNTENYVNKDTLRIAYDLDSNSFTEKYNYKAETQSLEVTYATIFSYCTFFNTIDKKLHNRILNCQPQAGDVEITDSKLVSKYKKIEIGNNFKNNLCK